MFGNFIYLIIVLLIYSTYQPPEETGFAPIETLIIFFSLIFIFACFAWIQFHRLEKRISQESFASLDHEFNSTLTRQSVIAVMLFAINIYGLDLTSLLTNISFFAIIPTFQALLFLGLFIGYLAIIWACAYEAYQKLYPTGLSRQSYILSNLSISIPVLFPWLILSGIADIIHALPFKLPKQFLATTEGEIVYFLVFLCIVAVIGPALIQKFWRCKPLETGYDRDRIEDLCKRAGVKYAEILYWPIFGGRMITAGVMGLTRKFRYILVTDALLRILEPEEINAVIAHEIGHVKKNHLLFYLGFFTGFMLLSYATFDLIIYFVVFTEPMYKFISSTGFSQTTMTSAAFSLITILIFIVYFRYIFGYFMRNFERQADLYVYTLFNSGKPLITTLEKIASSSGQPMDKPNWHHFSIKERIDYLKKCESDKIWINRHNRKIWNSIVVYLLVIFLTGCIGYNLNFGETGKKLNRQFLETIIQRELDKNPEDPNLYKILGDFYYSSKNYEETIKAYKQSLYLYPKNPEVLNNPA